jgi:ParB family chromosome partitioning protein
MAEKRKALGKGLSALLKEPEIDIEHAGEKGAEDVLGSTAEISIDKIKTNPFQPRTYH